LNLLDDHTSWVRGHIPAPLDECEFLSLPSKIAFLSEIESAVEEVEKIVLFERN